MKRTFKTKLLILLTALLSLFLLAGCSFAETKEDIMDKYGLTAQVTYHSNGGLFEDNKREKTIYYQAGTPALNIGVVKPTNGSADISREKYTFEGWYFVVDLNEETGECVLGEKVDFSTRLAEGDKWVIAAKWQAEVMVNIYLAAENNGTVPVDTAKSKIDKTELNNGELIGSLAFDGKTVKRREPTYFLTVKDSAYTFIEYYEDAACTTPVKFPIERGTENISIYARYIEGNWTLLKTKSDLVRNLYKDSEVENGEKFWLSNDIDCTGMYVSAMKSFDGILKGNGYKLKNLSVQSSNLVQMSKSAVFGEILEHAEIDNLTFENLQYECVVKSAPVDIYFVFVSLHEHAKINNVTISGGITIRKQQEYVVSNLTDSEGNLIYTHVLYGGYDNDAQYTSANATGFTVTGDPSTYVTITTRMY